MKISVCLASIHLLFCRTVSEKSEDNNALKILPISLFRASFIYSIQITIETKCSEIFSSLLLKRGLIHAILLFHKMDHDN
jgi:hypothetical protein